MAGKKPGKKRAKEILERIKRKRSEEKKEAIRKGKRKTGKIPGLKRGRQTKEREEESARLLEIFDQRVEMLERSFGGPLSISDKIEARDDVIEIQADAKAAISVKEKEKDIGKPKGPDERRFRLNNEVAFWKNYFEKLFPKEWVMKSKRKKK